MPKRMDLPTGLDFYVRGHGTTWKGDSTKGSRQTEVVTGDSCPLTTVHRGNGSSMESRPGFTLGGPQLPSSQIATGEWILNSDAALRGLARHSS